MEAPNVYKSFAQRLKMLRESAGFTQTELGNRLGCSRGSISFYEQVQRAPDIITLNNACDCFGVSSDYLLGRTDVRTPVPGIASAVKYTGLSEGAIEFLHNENGEKKSDRIMISERIIINALLTKYRSYLEYIAQNVASATLCRLAKNDDSNTFTLQKDGTAIVSADIAVQLFLDAAVDTFRDFLEDWGHFNG